MTRNLTISATMLVLVTVVVTACGGMTPTPTQEPSPTPAPTAAPTSMASPPSEIDWDDRELFREGLIEAERQVLDQLPGATVYHMDLEISDDFLLLEGRQEVRYTNRESEPLEEIYFRLFPNASWTTSSHTAATAAATVTGVKVDGEDVEPIYEFESSALRIPLGLDLEPGEAVVIEMDFEVDVPVEMGGNYGLFGYFEGVLALDEFYPVIPVYDDEGWNVEVPPPNADVTYLDASFYVVRVTAPASLTVVASGVEVGREEVDDKQSVTFAAGPARDFYLAASDLYTVVSDTVGETTVNSYALEERRDGAELALQYAVDALESFNDRFGPYPYTELDLVSTPMQALGIEYPGIMGMALELYDPQAEVLGLPSQILLESATAHEVGHQWFYNVVGNDQVDEPWLDEAIVQYVVALYYLDTGGPRAAQGYEDSWYGRWDRVDRADIPIGLPAGDYEGGEYGAIVYGRGPLFVEALSEKMGQQVFDEFLRDYYESHKWGVGTGESFKELAEQHCECDLTSLFEEWVYPK
jgi:hypothetical protein